MENEQETFLTVRLLAHRLGLPAAWLKSEAKAGRLPTLRAGRRLMFDLGEVRRALIERSTQNEAVRR